MRINSQCSASPRKFSIVPLDRTKNPSYMICWRLSVDKELAVAVQTGGIYPLTELLKEAGYVQEED